MANREQYEQDILDYLDGLLSVQARKDVEGRIASNADYQQFYNEIKSLRQQLKSLPAVKTSPDFDMVLLTRIRMERSIGKYGLPLGQMRLPLLVSAGALAALLLVFAGGPSRFSSPETSTAYSSEVIDSTQGTTNQSFFASSPTTKNVVNYPIDKVTFAGKGTAIESRNSRGRTAVDSLKATRQPDRQILPVEF